MTTVISQMPTFVTDARPGLAEDRKAKWLNDTSRQNLELVERGQRDRWTKIRSQYDELEDRRHKRDNARLRASSLERDRQNNIKFSEADVAALDRLNESVRAQSEKITKLSAITPEPVLDPSDIESFLASLPADAKLRPRPVPITLKKGQDEYAALLETRSEISTLNDKREKTLRAPLTHPEAIEAAVAEIKRKAERGAPKIGGLHRYSRTRTGRMVQGSIAWPQTNVVNDEFAKQAQNGVDFLCWLFPAEIEERIVSEIKARKYDHMLSRDARAALTVEIDDAILEAERREVELTRRLMLAGDARVSFRPGLSPLAVLSVENEEDDDGEATGEEAEEYDFEDTTEN